MHCDICIVDPSTSIHSLFTPDRRWLSLVLLAIEGEIGNSMIYLSHWIKSHSNHSPSWSDAFISPHVSLTNLINITTYCNLYNFFLSYSSIFNMLSIAITLHFIRLPWFFASSQHHDDHPTLIRHTNLLSHLHRFRSNNGLWYRSCNC